MTHRQCVCVCVCVCVCIRGGGQKAEAGTSHVTTSVTRTLIFLSRIKVSLGFLMSPLSLPDGR